jgi:hypothetical protein
MALAALVALAACGDAWDNRDTIEPSTGWAQVANDDLQRLH